MTNYAALLVAANNTQDDLQCDMLWQLQDLLGGGTGNCDSLASALQDTYESDAVALGVDEEDGITNEMSEAIGRTSAAKALDELADESVDVKLASEQLADAIGKRMLWLAAM